VVLHEEARSIPVTEGTRDAHPQKELVMSRRLAAISCCALALGCTPPTDPIEPPMPAPAATSGAEDGPRDGESVLPPPPTATLRAPADDRREEVAPESGLPPAQSQ
jgi:hypothetical protein